MSKKKKDDQKDRVLQITTMTSANEITIVSFIENGERVVKIGASHLADPATDDVEHVKALGGYVPIPMARELFSD